MRKVIEIIILCLFMFSCSQNDETAKRDIALPSGDSTLVNSDSTLLLVDDTLTDGISISYRENKGIIGIVLKGRRDSFISIGKYHNTFNQPPHEIDIKKVADKKYLIFVCTNQVQLGVSQDELIVFGFNMQTNKVTKMCNFQDLAVYSEETGIDTLVEIKQYDYETIRQKDPNKLTIQVKEYKPYKYINESLNKNISVKTINRSCDFSLDKF